MDPERKRVAAAAGRNDLHRRAALHGAESPDLAPAVPHRAELPVRSLPHALSPSLHRLPRPGNGLHRRFRSGDARAEHPGRHANLHVRRAAARRLDPRRRDAAVAAPHGAGPSCPARGGVRHGALPLRRRDLREVRPAAFRPDRGRPAAFRPDRGGGAPRPARQGPHRRRDLPRVCRHGGERRLPGDAPRIRPGAGRGGPRPRAGGRHEPDAGALHRGRIGRRAGICSEARLRP